MSANKKGGSTKTSGSTQKNSSEVAKSALGLLGTVPGIDNTISNRKNGANKSASRSTTKNTTKSPTKKSSEDLRKQYENEEGYQTSQTVINWWQGKRAKAAVPAQMKSEQEYKRSVLKLFSAIPNIGKTGGTKDSQKKNPYENEEGYQTSQFFINRYLVDSPESDRRKENFRGWLTGEYEKFFAGRDLGKKNEELWKYYKNEEGYNPELLRYLDAEYKRAELEYYLELELRGGVSQGATDNPMPYAYQDIGREEQMEWALQNAEDWVERHPGLGIFGHFIGNLSDNAEKSLSEKSTKTGNDIYNMNIPFLSDFGAAMLGSDLDSGDSVGAAIGGYFYGAGTAVLGAGKGMVDMAADPIQTARSLNWLINKPEESIPAIAKGAGEYINKNVINGNAESRGRAAGTLTVEIGAFFWGMGAAKGGKAADTATDAANISRKTSKLAGYGDELADAGNIGSKLVKGVERNIDNVMPGPGTIGWQPSSGIIGYMDDAGSSRLWYDKIKHPFDNSQGAGKKVKISNKVDDVVKGGSGALGNKPFKSTDLLESHYWSIVNSLDTICNGFFTETSNHAYCSQYCASNSFGVLYPMAPCGSRLLYRFSMYSKISNRSSSSV